MMRQKVVDEARLWIGVGFQHQGRSFFGIDCVGLLYMVYSKVLNIEDYIEYPPRPTTRMAFQIIQCYADRILQDEAQAGDVALLNFVGSSTHFGILTDNGIIHADSVLKKVVEHSLSKIYGSGKAVAYFRMKGIE